MDIVGADCCCFALCLYMGVSLSYPSRALFGFLELSLSFFYLFIP